MLCNHLSSLLFSEIKCIRDFYSNVKKHKSIFYDPTAVPCIGMKVPVLNLCVAKCFSCVIKNGEINWLV
jgi:hypothetical protein